MRWNNCAATTMDDDDARFPFENTTTSEIDFTEAENLPAYLTTISMVTFYFHFVLTAIAFLSIITTIKLKVFLPFISLIFSTNFWWRFQIFRHDIVKYKSRVGTYRLYDLISDKRPQF